MSWRRTWWWRRTRTGPGTRCSSRRGRSARSRCGPAPTGRWRAQPVPWLPRPSLQDTRDIAVLMMTSGTTGRPKRVELTYERMTAAFRAAGLVFDDVHKTRLHSRADILWASLAHISGLYFAVAHAVEGRSIALLERFEVGGVGRSWSGCTAPATSGCAPTALRMVLQAGRAGGDVRQRPRGRVRHRAAAAGTGGGVRGAVRNSRPRDLRRDRIRGRDRRLDAEGQEASGDRRQARQRRARPPAASNCGSSTARPAMSSRLGADRACSRRAAASCPGRTAPGCGPPTWPPSMTTGSCSSTVGRTRRSTGAVSRSRPA